MLVCTSAPAMAEGWSWSSLNPFSTGEAKSKTSQSSSWLGGKSLKSTKSKKSGTDKPSLLARMGSGTKNAWNRTKEALSVEDDEPKQEGRHYSWDNPSPYRRTKKKEESSWWSNWWRREEPHPSKTVQDFLSQERPEQVE
jgi:hypothetical protein